MSTERDSFWGRYHASLSGALRDVEVTTEKGESLSADEAMSILCDWTAQLRDRSATMHLTGNGASAAMASHMAADWTKNAGVRALAYNDAAFLTAIGNDLGYEHAFAGPVAWFARPGDMLVTISSSGNSPNVLQAIVAARARDCRVVTLSAMKPDNASRRRGDLNVFVPALTYGIAESSHAIILHAWFDQFMGVREWETTDRQTPPPLRAP
jgi:D-sedoheptulose 7-phosphate isomerase